MLDPVRRMRHDKTKEETPSLTFMPRALEIESYTEDELWRTADVGETYLDPRPPLLTKKEQRAKKLKAKAEGHSEKKDRLTRELANKEANDKDDGDSDSSYTDDSEYDEEYQDAIRAGYRNPLPYVRDRDFARKYSLSTYDLLCRSLKSIPTSQLLEDDSIVPSLLTNVSLDDLWQLVAEMRLALDQMDADLGADLHVHLIESYGVMTRQNVAWMRSTLQQLVDCVAHLEACAGRMSRPPELCEEIGALLADIRRLQGRTERTLNLLVASTGISQSSLVIDQTSGINKLTELAFFFVPLSFITSVFSMQVLELTETPPAIWTWGLSLGVVFLTTYVIRSILRSPSVRVLAMHSRQVMLDRFTSTSAKSASRRLNSVGNRAIAKYLCMAVLLLSFLFGLVAVYLFVCFVLYIAIWLGAVGTATYFIVVRWPEPAVLAPCFVSIALAAGGMATVWYWNSAIQSVAEVWFIQSLYWFMGLLPERWRFSNSDDDDLAKEGVWTYADQKVLLST